MADQPGRAVGPGKEEDVRAVIGVGLAGDQVGGPALEGHVLAVAADDRACGRAVAGRGRRACRAAHQEHGPGVAVVEEHVGGGVRIGLAGHQVGGRADERHVAPVGAEHRIERLAAGRRAGAAGGLADQPDRAVGIVEQEDVGEVVRVVLASDQVGGQAGKGHVPAVLADDRGVGGAIAGEDRRAGGMAHQARGARRSVEEEHVGVAVQIDLVLHEIVGVADERHVPPVGADRRLVGAAVARHVGVGRLGVVLAAQQLHGPGDGVVEVDAVLGHLHLAFHQVRGGAGEDHEAAIGAGDRLPDAGRHRAVAVAGGGRCGGIAQADVGARAGGALAKDHVGELVAVALSGHQVAGVGEVGDELAVAGEHRHAGIRVARAGRGIALVAEQLTGAGVPIVHEDVRAAVAVDLAGRQVGGGAGKGHEAPVGADHGPDRLLGPGGDGGRSCVAGQLHEGIAAAEEEDVRAPVEVDLPAGEVGGAAGKGHVLAAAADGRREEADEGVAGRLVAGGRGGSAGMADQLVRSRALREQEDVLGAVGVGLARHQVGGQALVGHVLAVGADDRSARALVGRRRGRRAGVTDQLPRARGGVEKEDVGGGVVVAHAGDEVRALTRKGHQAAVAADRGRVGPQVARRRSRGRAPAHQLKGAGGPRVKEDVLRVVAVDLASDQVGGLADQSDIGPVGAEHGTRRSPIAGRRRAGAGVADQLHAAVDPVVEEDVELAVGVGLAGDQVRGVAAEEHEATVGADAHGDRHAGGGRDRASGLVAHERRRAGLLVAEEHVGVPVGVVAALLVDLTGHEIGRVAGEGHVAAVAADPGPAPLVHAAGRVAGQGGMHQRGGLDRQQAPILQRFQADAAMGDALRPLAPPTGGQTPIAARPSEKTTKHRGPRHRDSPLGSTMTVPVGVRASSGTRPLRSNEEGPASRVLPPVCAEIYKRVNR